jgi:hypothetical protein
MMMNGDAFGLADSFFSQWEIHHKVTIVGIYKFLLGV